MRNVTGKPMEYQGQDRAAALNAHTSYQQIIREILSAGRAPTSLGAVSKDAVPIARGYAGMAP
jgi:hypothetical protein